MCLVVNCHTGDTVQAERKGGSGTHSAAVPSFLRHAPTVLVRSRGLQPMKSFHIQCLSPR